MREEGASLELLIARLEQCPPEFLLEPAIGDAGMIRVAAVVSDLLRDLGGESLTALSAAPFVSDLPSERNRLRLVLVVAWLLHDDWFISQARFAEGARTMLDKRLAPLAAVADAERFIVEPDRREELVRFCLAALNLRPAGESIAQAQDRLQTLDSIEKRRIIRETRAAQEHAARVRDAMRRKAAEEAAAKVSRE